MSESEEVYESVDEMVADGAAEVTYKSIDGFKEGKKIRIGSLTADDMIIWSEANEGEAKRTAGLRLIAKSLVNSKGVRISSDKDIQKFRQMRHDVTERIVKEIINHNKMSSSKDKELKND